MKVRFSHLSLSERRKIERWRQMNLHDLDIRARQIHSMADPLDAGTKHLNFAA